jgi:hypothetical protein
MGDIMIDLENVRAWARAHDHPVSRKGPVSYEVRVAYAEAHGLEPPTPPKTLGKVRNVTFNASCDGCGRKWQGLRECHCYGCHLHFTSVTGFDAHRGERNKAHPRGRCLELGDIVDSDGRPKFVVVPSKWGPIVTRALREGETPRFADEQEELPL